MKVEMYAIPRHQFSRRIPDKLSPFYTKNPWVQVDLHSWRWGKLSGRTPLRLPGQTAETPENRQKMLFYNHIWIVFDNAECIYNLFKLCCRNNNMSKKIWLRKYHFGENGCYENIL